MIVQNVATGLLAAILIPLSLFVTLLIVRGISFVWFSVLGRRPLPVIINYLAPENGNGQSSEDPAGLDAAQRRAWQDLPGMLRDYVSIDPPLSRQLAPGVGSAASPTIPAAAPGSSQPSWSAALVDLVLPQKKAAYNIYVTPKNPSSGRLSAGVMVVKAPEQWIESSRTFDADNIDELVLKIGGFCMQCVQLQPPFLRRTPRWEHWGSSDGYTMFREALWLQGKGAYEYAYEFYEQASERSLGNVRLGVYRASLYELQEDYRKATLIYDALHCLWKQNVEVAYRAAAARVNWAHKLFEEDPGILVLPGTGSGRSFEPRELILIGEAQVLLGKIRKDLRFRVVLWKWLRTWFPRRRDVGERRYWASWLRRDTFRQPLMLLRRSRRYEYLNAVKIALEANCLLECLVRSRAEQPLPHAFDMNDSVLTVSELLQKKRIGWLANWAAACYFSRAAQAADLISPTERYWRRQEKKLRAKSSAGLMTEAESPDWRRYCEEMAIGEIGRVLRNPCHQLNIELLTKDPDMKPLRNAFKAGMVSVLIGPIAEPEHS